MRYLFCCFALLALVSGCGKGDGDDNKSPSAGGDTPAAGTDKDTASDKAFPAAKATASIKGKITFDGAVPAIANIKVEGDAYCVKHHNKSPLKDESLIVGVDKSIKNVVVFVKKFPSDWEFEAPKQAVVMNQQNCTYSPHVTGIMTKQPLKFKNSDASTHNVHLMAKKNRFKKTNFTQAEGEETEITFKRGEVGTAYAKCDIHSWMKSYICIFTHPFYQVTGDDGTFELGKLPAGEYEISIWHETLGKQTQTVTLKDGGAETLNFTLKQQ